MKQSLVVFWVLGVLLASCGSKKEFKGFTYPDGNYKALILSYDDGTIEDIDLVELLNKNGLKGTFNLNSAYIGARRGWPQQNGDTIYQEYVPRDTLNTLYENHEIAAHGAYHKDFIKSNKQEILEEVQTDIEVLNNLTGRQIVSMAYPFGNTNDTIASFISTTPITNARTVNDTHTFELPDNYLIWNPSCHDSKVSDYSETYIKLDTEELSLFYIWGHSWEFKDEDRWNAMVDFCTKMGAEKNIWSVGTGEYTEYLKALDKVEIKNGTLYNPANNSAVWVNLSDQIIKVEPGESIKAFSKGQ